MSSNARSSVQKLTERVKKKRQGLARRRRGGSEIAAVAESNQFGWWNKALFTAVRVLHLIDVITGALCIAYGATLHINKKYATYGSYFVYFGSLLVFSSFIGYVGFKSPVFKRIGLRVSAYMGVVIGILDVGIGITLVTEKNSLTNTLNKHNDDFDLTKTQVKNLEKAFIPIVILCFFFAALEFARFYCLRKLRSDLVSIETIVQTSSSIRGQIGEPLLDQHSHSGSDTDSDFAPVDGQLYTDGNWWADKNQFQEVVENEAKPPAKSNDIV